MYKLKAARRDSKCTNITGPIDWSGITRNNNNKNNTLTGVFQSISILFQAMFQASLCLCLLSPLRFMRKEKKGGGGG